MYGYHAVIRHTFRHTWLWQLRQYGRNTIFISDIRPYLDRTVLCNCPVWLSSTVCSTKIPGNALKPFGKKP
eukprot:9369109-Ditylum_brightwellii.AAC.1